MQDHMMGTWNWMLIGLSFLASAFGSYVALENVKIYRERQGSGWLVAAALAMGAGGIWTMHFIGMLALDMDVAVSYEPVTTAASMLLAIAVTGLAFFIVGRSGVTAGPLLGAGLLMGLGVASMHYLGMAAMRMPASIEYDRTLVVLSVVIAVVAATAALWLAFRVHGAAQVAGAAVVMAAAVCSMHYTGMAAARMTENAGRQVEVVPGLSPTVLAFAIFLVICSVLLLMLRKALHEAALESA